MGGKSYVTVTAEVDIDDVLSELSDNDLKEYGLCRLDPASEPDELRAALYQAAESGSCAAMFQAVEAMAWALDGKILVTRMAA